MGPYTGRFFGEKKVRGKEGIEEQDICELTDKLAT